MAFSVASRGAADSAMVRYISRKDLATGAQRRNMSDKPSPFTPQQALAFVRKVPSVSAGDTRKPEFVALNPRHTVATLVDGDFVLYESNAITAYLDDGYPGRGAPLFPGDAKTRATVWRLMLEVDA